MNILILSPYPHRIAATLSRFGGRVIATAEPINVGLVRDLRIEWAVSYGYRHILCREIVDALGGRIVNLHISALPWNRGGDPNFWSFFDDTRKGVTIHRIDAGIDTGDILAQRLVQFGDGETLATTYDRLQAEVEALFAEVWGDLRAGTVLPRKQPDGGSHHRRRDKEIFIRLLPDGWNTPVAVVERLGCDWRRTAVRIPASASDWRPDRAHRS